MVALWLGRIRVHAVDWNFRDCALRPARRKGLRHRLLAPASTPSTSATPASTASARFAAGCFRSWFGGIRN